MLRSCLIVLAAYASGWMLLDIQDEQIPPKQNKWKGQIIIMPDGKRVGTIGEARKTFKKLVWSWDGPGDLGEKHVQNEWRLSDLDIRKTAEANGYDWKTDDWYQTFKLTVKPKKIWDK